MLQVKGGLITCCHYHEKFLKETNFNGTKWRYICSNFLWSGPADLVAFLPAYIYITVLTKSSVLPSSFQLNRFQDHPVAKLMTLYCLILWIVDQFVCWKQLYFECYRNFIRNLCHSSLFWMTLWRKGRKKMCDACVMRRRLLLKCTH